MYETIGSTRLMMFNKPTNEKENCANQQSIYYTLFETKAMEELLNYGDNKITREVHIRSKAKKKTNKFIIRNNAKNAKISDHS